MRKLSILSAISFLVLTMGFIAVNGQGMIVKGRVIDLKGEPIQNVGITLYPRVRSGDIDQIGSGTLTEKDGRFVLSEERSWNVQSVIFLKMPADPFSANPFHPPYSRYVIGSYSNWRKLIPASPATKGQKTIDVGDISADFPLTRSSVKLAENLIPSDVNIFDVWMVLSAEKSGRSVEEMILGALYNDSAYDGKSVISLSLPKGPWKISICDTPTCKKVYGRSTLVNLKDKPVVFQVLPVSSRSVRRRAVTD